MMVLLILGILAILGLVAVIISLELEHTRQADYLRRRIAALQRLLKTKLML